MNPAIITLARSVLTPKQLEVWQLHHQHHMSFRAIAIRLDISRTTVTDRYDNACRALRKAGVTVTPDGTHYHQEPA